MHGNNKKQKLEKGKQAQNTESKYNYLLYKFESAKGKRIKFLIKLIKQYNRNTYSYLPHFNSQHFTFYTEVLFKQH